MPKSCKCSETTDTEGLMHNCQYNGCNCSNCGNRSCIGYIMAFFQKLRN